MADLDRAVWQDVIASLEEFLPFYERVNQTATLFQIDGWRRRAAGTLAVRENALEIGPGPGSFARLTQCRRFYLLEASPAIAATARTHLQRPQFRHLVGLAEHIPLRGASLDKVFCIFSFRDFMEKRRSLREVSRVLRPRGELHIVDLFRAPPGIERWVMDTWLRVAGAAILRVIVPPDVRRGWRYDPYAELLRTYRSAEDARVSEGLMKEVGFVQVRSTDLLLRSVYHLQGVKPSTT